MFTTTRLYNTLTSPLSLQAVIAQTSLETNQPTEMERGEVTQVNTIQEDISSATFIPKSTEAYSLCSLREEMSKEEKHANLRYLSVKFS